MQRKLFSLPNITVITEALTTEVIGNGEKVTALKYKSRNTDEIATVELEGIFVQIGLLPNTDFLKRYSAAHQSRAKLKLTRAVRLLCPACLLQVIVLTYPTSKLLLRWEQVRLLRWEPLII